MSSCWNMPHVYQYLSLSTPMYRPTPATSMAFVQFWLGSAWCKHSDNSIDTGSDSLESLDYCRFRKQKLVNYLVNSSIAFRDCSILLLIDTSDLKIPLDVCSVFDIFPCSPAIPTPTSDYFSFVRSKKKLYNWDPRYRDKRYSLMFYR